MREWCLVFCPVLWVGSGCGDKGQVDTVTASDSGSVSDTSAPTDSGSGRDSSPWSDSGQTDSGQTDSGETGSELTDADGDGYAAEADDCDDTNADIHPGADESCDDSVDSDCDGVDPACGLIGTFTADDADFVIQDEYTAGGAYKGGNAARGRFAGDLSGDGLPDLLVHGDGEPFNTEPNHDSGTIYVISTPTTDWDAAFAQSPETAYVIRGQDSDQDDYGEIKNTFGLGDVDGDGQDDLGANFYPLPASIVPDRGGSQGGTCVLSGPVPATGEALPAAFDFCVVGDDDNAFGISQLGRSTAPLGDMNGDGYGDFAFSNHLFESGGAAWVFFGPLTATKDWGDADAMIHTDYSGAQIGEVVAGPGDIDGDGIADLIVSSPDWPGGWYDEEYHGLVNAFFGPLTGVNFLDDADITWQGPTAPETGRVIESAGDTNGDGYTDVVMSSPLMNGSGYYYGAALIHLGPMTSGTYPWDSHDAALAETDWYARYAGSDVAGVGDLDGDGFADIALGSGNGAEDDVGPGKAWLHYGPFTGTIDLADAHFTFEGPDDDVPIDNVTGLGDIDGDGLDDVMFGAAENHSPYSWIFLGGDAFH